MFSFLQIATQGCRQAKAWYLQSRDCFFVFSYTQWKVLTAMTYVYEELYQKVVTAMLSFRSDGENVLHFDFHSDLEKEVRFRILILTKGEINV